MPITTTTSFLAPGIPTKAIYAPTAAITTIAIMIIARVLDIALDNLILVHLRGPMYRSRVGRKKTI